MKKTFITILKVSGIVIAIILLLLVIATVALNSPTVQNKLQRRATKLLSDKLGTQVSIDSISISLWEGGIDLYRLEVWDQKGVKMLEADTLQASLNPLKLLRKDIEVVHANLHGCRAKLYKMAPDTVANYQFIIDSLKRKPTTPDTTVPKKKKQKLSLGITRASLTGIDIDYQTSKEVRQLLPPPPTQTRRRKIPAPQEEVVIKELHQKIHLERLTYQKKRFARHGKGSLTIEGLRYWNDNHLPRKNTGKKNRGWFDPKHIDITADMDIALHYAEADSISATLKRCTATDYVTGIDIRDLRLSASTDMKQLRLTDVIIQQGENTTLQIDTAHITLPSKKHGRSLTYTTATISGKTQLRDISRPFAPVLADFRQPLCLHTTLSGNDSTMQFHDIYVATPDSTLQVWAEGGITDIKDKYKLKICFNVSRMTAKGDIKQKIINQFPVKKYMMSQLSKLGNISYKGHVNILWRKEQFDGILNTAMGGLWFNFYLDEENKYLVGNVSTDSINLAKLTDMKNLGRLACKADFSFDISKPRTAAMRKKIGGKLPMGNIRATIQEATFKKMKFHNIEATIKSNGAIAEGNIVMRGKRIDGLCKFSFTNTDSISKMKIRPNVKIHGLSADDKAEKERIKAEKKAAKEAKKARKAEEKAARKAEKEKAKEKEK